jgi:arylsulfatase A
MHLINMHLIKYLYLFIAITVSQKSILIVDVPMGYDDNVEISRYLPFAINDFTVASSDTDTSHAAFIDGKLKGPLVGQALDNMNMYQVLKGKIPVGHFGAWNFDQVPNVDTYVNTDDPQIAINSAIEFIKNKNNYVIVIFMPKLSDLYAVDRPPAGQDPLRGPYKTILNNKDVIIGKLLKSLKNVFVIWAPVHGPIDPHIYPISDPKSSLRGAQYSLYDGGIRVRLRYSLDTLMVTNPFVVKRSINAIDIAPTILSLYKLELPGSDGINIFKNDVRSKELAWTTNIRAEGNCINASPMFAKQIVHEGILYKMLYDANPNNDQVYKWNSGYEFKKENIIINVSRPNVSAVLCEHFRGPTGPVTGLASPAGPESIKGIIFIMVDDVGLGDISYFSPTTGPQRGPQGGPAPFRGPRYNYPSTPNIDKLAAEGLVLTDFHSASTICTPTRYAAFTGRHPSNKYNPIRQVYAHTIGGTVKNVRPPYMGSVGSNEFVTTYFKSKNWTTGHFGKMHVYQPSTLLKPDFFDIDAYKCQSCYAPFGKTYIRNKNYNAYSSKNITDDSISWLNSLDPYKKFYLNIWYNSMHSPVMSIPGQFNPDRVAGPQGGPAPFRGPLRVRIPYGGPETPLKIYNDLLGYLDLQIGRILDFVKERYDDNVIIIFHSDNGPEDASMDPNSVGDQGPYRGRKRSNYEGGHRVPSIIKLGTRIQGTSHILGATYDFFPTLVGMTGGSITDVPGYRTLDGLDLSSCFSRDRETIGIEACSKTRNRVLRWESVWPYKGSKNSYGTGPRFAVRWDNYTCFAHSTEKIELKKMRFSNIECYDLSIDILQQSNIRNPVLVKKFLKLLISWPNYDTKYFPGAIYSLGPP